MKISLGFMLLFCSFIVTATATATSNDLILGVSARQSSFPISLSANPTTGYEWSVVDFDKNLLTLSGAQFVKPDTDLIGAGGHTIFTFSLNAGESYPAKTKMVFKYARSWDENSATIKNVTVNFK